MKIRTKTGTLTCVTLDTLLIDVEFENSLKMNTASTIIVELYIWDFFPLLEQFLKTIPEKLQELTPVKKKSLPFSPLYYIIKINLFI